MAQHKYDFTSPALRALRWLAWVNLACGLIGAVVIWIELGWRYVSAGLRIKEASPMGIVLGIAALLAGATLCALLFVICDAAESISRTELEVTRAKERKS